MAVEELQYLYDSLSKSVKTLAENQQIISEKTRGLEEKVSNLDYNLKLVENNAINELNLFNHRLTDILERIKRLDERISGIETHLGYLAEKQGIETEYSHKEY